MIKYISFDCFWPRFNLSERAELLGTRQLGGLFYYYQLTNKHNPKVKFSIVYYERDEFIYNFKIDRIRE